MTTEPLSHDLTARILQAAITSLRNDVLPHIGNPSARIHTDMITRILWMLEKRFSRRGEDLRRLLAEDRQLLDSIAHVVPQAAKATSLPAAPAFSAIETLEQRVYQTELDAIANLPPLLELASVNSPERGAAVACLRGIIDAQERFLSAQDPDIRKGSYVCFQGGRIDEERRFDAPLASGAALTNEALGRHLQRQFPGSRVEDLTVIAGGFSKVTALFTLVQAAGESEQLVMRKDLPVDYITRVSYEFPLLQRMFRAGFPVAEPRWLEDDPLPFGGRFMVSRRVAGTTDISRWAGDAKQVERFARQLAKLMVELHSIPLEQLGYPHDMAGKSAGELTRMEIERWYAVLQRDRKEAYPIEEITLAWLRRNIPRSAFGRPGCLTHGDIGFHNLMIDQGEVTALLDWELSHPGDPIEDLLFTKPFIEKVMDWEAFKGFYREYGGAPHSAEEEAFYLVWSKARHPITSLQAVAIFSDALPDNIKFASAGFVLGRYPGLEAGKLVLEALGNPGR